MPERYFLEDWMRGEKGDLLREALTDPDKVHPHITFVRPFTIPDGNEEFVKKLIADYCKDKKPITFILKGKNHFSNGVIYSPVISEELLEFNNGLERLLEGKVAFDEKLADDKILHLTITNQDFEGIPETLLPMLRLTCIKDKKIWFSWDFELNQILNREESLDKWTWGLTKAFYYHDLHPGKPNPLMQRIREAVYIIEAGDPGDEFADIGGDFYMATIDGCSFGKDISLYEEMAPTVFNYYSMWLKNFSDRKEEKTDMQKFDTLMAFNLSDAYVMAFVSGSADIMNKFEVLKEDIKSKQTDYGKGLTEHMVERLRVFFTQKQVNSTIL